ncbi:MAG: cation:proton antiporter [Bacillota bacterium]
MASDVILNTGLAFVFISAAIMLASRINFSSIPFLIFLGMMVGPHAPDFGMFSLKIITGNESVQLLSRLGVLLMLFYLGLEFSTGKIAEAGKKLFKSGSVYVALNFARGLALGWVFFNSWAEAMVVAGITGISSSAIITKLLVDLKRTANPETELILGIMVFEDIFIALYLSVLSGIMVAGSFNPWVLTVNILAIFLLIIATIVFGRRIGRVLEERLKFKSAEPFIVAVFTLLLATGILAEKIHVAEAIGALLLGLVLAETSHSHRIVQMITPMRDLFGAMFFFSFGMAINYRTFKEVVVVAAVAVLVTVFGNVITGYIASWISGYKKRRAANVALTIMARGEFAIIIASIAYSNGLDGRLPAFAALYVVILAFISPVLARNTKPLHEWLERAGSFWARQKSAGNGVGS